MKKNSVSCFDIGEVPRSPGKWNWNWLYFLPFIFTFEQGDVSFLQSINYLDLSRCVIMIYYFQNLVGVVVFAKVQGPEVIYHCAIIINIS